MVVQLQSLTPKGIARILKKTPTTTKNPTQTCFIVLLSPEHPNQTPASRLKKLKENWSTQIKDNLSEFNCNTQQ